ncbi:MAG TPA: hypothetical protein VFY88_07260 [Intrasporangium sp.]|nr:hypothetical protein [Intrasporangium sp.]
MPNWDGLSKLFGWIPGAGLGGLLGGILGLLGFESMATPCATGTIDGPFGPLTTSLPCVQTVFGDVYAATGFAAMTGVIGMAIGIAVQLGHQALTKPAAPAGR